MSVDAYEAQLAREQLYGLLNRCPLENNAETCEFCRWRDEPLDLRHRWLLDLDDEECLALARKHHECIESQLHEQKAVNA